MKFIPILITIAGLLAMLVGVIWMGQGSGVFPYPAQSFMINQSPWIWRGMGLLVAGMAVVWLSRRYGR